MSHRPLIDCEEALRRLAEFLDSELDPAMESAVARHLDTCRSCYSRAEFEKRLKRSLRDRLSTRDVPESYESRIRSLLSRLS